jgi:hypothetical protein
LLAIVKLGLTTGALRILLSLGSMRWLRHAAERGDVALVQRRRGPGHFDYIVVRVLAAGAVAKRIAA